MTDCCVSKSRVGTIYDLYGLNGDTMTFHQFLIKQYWCIEEQTMNTQQHHMNHVGLGFLVLHLSRLDCLFDRATIS